MGNVVTGYHWDTANPEEITGEKLNETGSGTVSGITQSDLLTGTSLITIGTSAPPTATGVAWFDTTQGAGRGLFKLFDNGRWTTVAQGFLGWNNGTGLARGNLVVYDPTLTPATVGTVPVIKNPVGVANSVQMSRPIGVAAEGITNGATGIILDYGYATCLKDAATVTAGDALVASSNTTTAGYGTSGNLGSWGPVGGSPSLGRWMDTSSGSAGTEVSVFLHGATAASWNVFKNSGGTVVYNAISVTATAGESFTGTNAFATAPIGTIAHICQVKLAYNQAAVVTVAIGLRMVNASVTESTGAAYAGGNFTGIVAPAVPNNFRCQLIVPETTAASSNQLQYSLAATDTGANRFTLSVYEVGVIVGGQIV
jgi:hypothetical protein